MIIEEKGALPMRVYNFSAGPAALPVQVLRQAAAEMLDWNGSGMGVMEMSHRGPEFMGIHAEAVALLRELLAVPANYKILFMQGGGLAENAIVPLNLMGRNPRADFVVTGSWSKKSFKEAQRYGTINLAADAAQEGKYRSIPPVASWKLDASAAYVHVCTNETIDGVEILWHSFRDAGDTGSDDDDDDQLLAVELELLREFNAADAFAR